MTASTHEQSKNRSKRRAPLRETLSMPEIPTDVMAAYRPLAPALTERIVKRTMREVAAFAQADDPNIPLGIAQAIDQAVGLFIEAAAGAPTSPSQVYSFYRWLGRYQAEAGHNLDAMRAAHQIATHESWIDLRDATHEMGQPDTVVAQLGDSLLAYQNALFEQAVLGYMEYRRDANRDLEKLRSRLLRAIICGAPGDEIDALAARCSWSMPDEVAVGVTEATDTAAALLSAEPKALVGVRDDRLILIAATETTLRLARDVAGATAQTMSLSWGVKRVQAHDAIRWAGRGLELVGEGHIEVPDDHVVDCEKHQTLLCLHADPALRQVSDDSVLAPLLNQTQKRRMALAETMLLWLQTHESAPCLAARLGVHDQTVRHRLRRLRDLFGARLHDPSQTAILLIALESSILRWRRASA